MTPTENKLRAALQDCLSAWARGDKPGDFGEHEAVKKAKVALSYTGHFGHDAWRKMTHKQKRRVRIMRGEAP